MGTLNRIRSAITGRFVNTNEAAASPDTTVRETFSGNDELRAAAEGVILGAGYPVEGRTTVNEPDLDRLRAAVGFQPGQP